MARISDDIGPDPKATFRDETTAFAPPSQGRRETAEALARRLSELEPAPPEALEPPYDALIDAIEAGDLAAMRAVLETAAPDLNLALPPYGLSPLMRALKARGRSVDTIRLLILHGADVTFCTRDGFSPLHAIGDYSWRAEGDPELDRALARLLVAHGADLEARNGAGLTPLLRAIDFGVAAEVAALLSVGADPDSATREDAWPPHQAGQTALMIALAQPDVVRLLLDHGADPERIAPGGFSVLELADQILAEGDGEEETDLDQAVRASRSLIRAHVMLN